MHEENPYQSPATDATAFDPLAPPQRSGVAPPERDRIAELTTDTLVPRHIAASLDLMLVFVLALIVAKQLPDRWPLVQTLAAVAVYPAFFLLWEGLTARTPGKLLTGLVIVDYDGRRCSWRQTLVRTLFRMFEVNPMLFGALPAAICIATSSRRQRLGDKAALTIVVPARRLKKRKAKR